MSNVRRFPSLGPLRTLIFSSRWVQLPLCATPDGMAAVQAIKDAGSNARPVRAFARAASSVLATTAALLLATVALAQTYTVQVNSTLNDLDIKVEHLAQSTMLIMQLTNNTDTRVRCNLRYDAAPQTPRRTTVFVNPGRTEQNVFRAQRRWFSVTVNVECSPAPR